MTMNGPSNNENPPAQAPVVTAPVEILHRPPRKLILCFDGTGNKFRGDESDSNILKIFRMLDREADDQYHYYQPGIGTYVVSDKLSHTGLTDKLRGWYAKAKDSAVGSSFDHHVIGGYRFLMRFYNPDDEIYMFGFSRGAYIARFLAEMIDYVGLLSHGNEEMVRFAWKAFSQWQCRDSGSRDTKGGKKKHEMYEFIKGFRETFSRPVRRIRFLGLFDTVNSVPRFEAAWMERSKFPYTARSSAKVIRHVVSIDERRAKFRQDLLYQEHPKHKKTCQAAVNSSKAKQAATLGADEEERDMRRAYRRKLHPPLHGEKSEHGDADRGRRRAATSLQVPGAAPNSQAVEGAEDPEQPQLSRYRSHSRHRTSLQIESVGSVAGGTCDASSIASYISHGPLSIDSDDEEQDLDEIWCVGGHADIGGGWDVEAGRRSVSHIPLVWMVREAQKAGLQFDPEKLERLGCVDCVPKTSTSPQLSVPNILVDGHAPPSATPAEQNGDPLKREGLKLKSEFHEMLEHASLSKIHDSLSFGGGLPFGAVLSWKIMEWLPFRRMDLQPDGSWSPIRWPLPRGEVRDIPDNVRVHGSVIRRMKADPSYRPGNLIVGGGGRGCRVAPEEHGIGDWVCVAEEGDPIGEVWMKKTNDR
ncbi:hypothetical protein MKZ38_007882 [Zalerion maritima]|uniref:T6SS Phospholipase effector Tle1-like catalytic domain-containing protein n=1 Tax=Zalerion maritima TaxID=339359 RepID=A0AAD5WNX0_9PEZI|nr:hypothetical protein MKZ38_007882 [Zalerion maritima]